MFISNVKTGKSSGNGSTRSCFKRGTAAKHGIESAAVCGIAAHSFFCLKAASVFT
jgi:hypothetical protein